MRKETTTLQKEITRTMQREIIVAQREANEKQTNTKRHTMQEDKKKNKIRPKCEL